MKQYGLFWRFFFGTQSLIAQTDSIRTGNPPEAIPCFAECLDRTPLPKGRDTLCCRELLKFITISQVQESLNRKGFSLKVDGRFNEETKKAWIAFEKEKGFPTHADWELVSIFHSLGILKRIEVPKR
jgi:hypothetical protein